MKVPLENQNGDGYKPPYTLTESIVSLVGRITEAVGRMSVAGDQALCLRRASRMLAIVENSPRISVVGFGRLLYDVHLSSWNPAADHEHSGE